MGTGNVVSGNMASLLISDDNRLVMQPTATASAMMAPIALEVSGTSPTSTAGSLRFTLESSGSSPNLSQRIYLFSYATNSWELLDTRASTTGDSTAEVVVSTNASRFIDPTTRAIKARMEWRTTGAIFSYPWSSRVDFVRWNILP